MFDPADPNQCLAAQLRAGSRLLGRAYDEALAPSGLTATQFSVLARLSAGPMSVAVLAEALDTERSGMSRNLQLLEAAGLVTRAKPDGGRGRLVRLTAEGASRLASAMPLWRAIQARLNGRLGGALCTELLQDLAALRHAL